MNIVLTFTPAITVLCLHQKSSADKANDDCGHRIPPGLSVAKAKRDGIVRNLGIINCYPKQPQLGIVVFGGHSGRGTIPIPGSYRKVNEHLETQLICQRLKQNIILDI